MMQLIRTQANQGDISLSSLLRDCRLTISHECLTDTTWLAEFTDNTEHAHEIRVQYTAIRATDTARVPKFNTLSHWVGKNLAQYSNICASIIHTQILG